MKFSAVILAGGQSSRMGRDKAFLEIAGQTLLARQIQIVQEAGVTDIFISGRTGVDYSAFGLRVLADKFPEAGPLAGIHAALRQSKNPMLVVLAVDMTAMNATFLRSLMSAAASGMGVIPRLADQCEPLAAIYSRAALDYIEKRLAAGNFAVREFAETCVREQLANYFDVPPAFSQLFHNANSPADLPCWT